MLSFEYDTIILHNREATGLRPKTSAAFLLRIEKEGFGLRKRRIWTAILIVVWIVSCVSILPGRAYAVTDSGTCGANAVWTLSEDGVLTVSGIGDMLNYPSELKTPWYSYRTKIVRVVIEDGVTAIGSYAFANCKNLLSVSIPNSIESIGQYAFYYCRALTDVTIPASVSVIGSSAFRDCGNLSTVTFEANCQLSGIASNMFASCTSLNHITLPDSITNIGSGAFDNCSSLTDISIPNGVASIGFAAFMQCKKLTGITIPDSVTSIGDYAFQDCSSLIEITFTGDAPSIGKTAFERVTATVSYSCDNAGWTAANRVHYNGILTWVGQHNYTSAVTNPTCSQQGFTTYTCSCGDSYTDDYVNSLAHSYSADHICVDCGQKDPDSQEDTTNSSTSPESTETGGTPVESTNSAKAEPESTTQPVTERDGSEQEQTKKMDDAFIWTVVIIAFVICEAAVVVYLKRQK